MGPLHLVISHGTGLLKIARTPADKQADCQLKPVTAVTVAIVAIHKKLQITPKEGYRYPIPPGPCTVVLG